MLRRLVVLSALAAMVSGGLAVLPDGAVPVAVAAEPDLGEGDSPESPAVPLQELPQPADPASAIEGLPNDLAQLPGDEASSVTVDGSWSDVPGLPVEVQVGEPADEPLDPSQPTEPTEPTPSPSADATPSLSRTTDRLGSGLGEPDPEALEGEAGSGEVVPPEGGEVVVSLERPDDLGLGVLLLQVETADPLAATEPSDSVPAPDPTEEAPVEPSPSEASSGVDPMPSAALLRAAADPTSEPTDEPSADPSDSPSPTAPTPSEPTPSDPSEQPEPVEPGDPGLVPATGVDVRLSYAGFDTAFGGGWADRLQVVAYPACYLETPELPECGVGVPVEAVNDPAADTLTFTTVAPEEVTDPEIDPDTGLPVDAGAPDADGSAMPSSPSSSASGAPALLRTVGAPPAAEETAATVYAVTAGSGSYAAQPVTPSASWQVGVGSGEFTYEYPFEMPSALGGDAPSLALSYSSAAVDGMTMVDNGQAPATGLGWADLSPGFITRSYASCKDDGHSTKGDLCWKTYQDKLVNEYNLVLNGQSSPLVRIGDSNSYRVRDDQGWRVELYQSATPGDGEPQNADNNNEGFKVTTPDGTKYWFGLGFDGTNSVWTVPVYGNDAGEPCHDATIADAWCQQAWRWNLDRVIDSKGNQIRYFYEDEINHYARWANTTEAYRTAYDRSGSLVRVEYGFDRNSGQPRQMATISRTKRCTPQLSDPSADCSGTNGPRAAPGKWPDVPSDLICDGSDEVCTVGSPSFFTTNRYHEVNTFTIEGNDGAKTTRPVDTYTLDHSMPDPDGDGSDEPDLWLNKITRTGHLGGENLSLPVVDFNGGDPLPNRVAPAGGRPFKKYRVTSVRNETGGRIDVDYGHAENMRCDAAYVDGRPRYNGNKECWAQRWTPPAGGDPQWEWFHKYVVTRVSLADDALGYRLGASSSSNTVLGQLRVYDYEYEDEPAWRFTNSYNVPMDDESWTDWRGYGQTKIHTRKTQGGNVEPGDVAVQRVVRYRGMYGSRKNLDGDEYTKAEAHLSTAEFTATEDEPEDHAWLAGLTAETANLRPGTQDLINRSYTHYRWFHTASEGRRDARIRFPGYTVNTTAVEGGPNRTRKLDYRVEDGDGSYTRLYAGVINRVEDHGDPDDAEDNICTTTTWAGNTDEWIRVPAITQTYGSTCNAVDNGNGVLVAQTHNYYDQLATSSDTLVGGYVRDGLLTHVETSTGHGPILTRTAYDDYGRVTRTWDGNGNLTTTDYNPHNDKVSDLTTRIKVTDPKDFTTVTDLDPRKGLPVAVTDANGQTTNVTYNGLGQPRTVTLPGNTTGTPSIEYIYDTSAFHPSRVWTRTLRTPTARNESYTFYDGWGRAVETQVPQPSDPAKRIVSVTGYDNQGGVAYTMPHVPNANETNFESVLNPAPTTVARYTVDDHDAIGRLVKSTKMSTTAIQGITETEYRGNQTITKPPIGGFTRTALDPWGRAQQIDLLEGRSLTAAVGDSAKYTYTTTGQLKTIKKSLDGTEHTWAYGYDLAGRKTWADDPDTGASVYGYDDNGNLTVTATGTSVVGADDSPSLLEASSLIQTKYDVLNRPTLRTDATSALPGVLPFVPDKVDELDHSSDKALTNWYYDTSSVANSKGRVTQIDHAITGVTPPGGTAPGVFSTRVGPYDATGNPTSTADVYPVWLTGETANLTEGRISKISTTTYNHAGQPITATRPAEADLPAQPISHSYTIGGALNYMSTPAAGGGSVTLADATYNNVAMTTALMSANPAGADLARTYAWSPSTARLQKVTGTIEGLTTFTQPGLSLEYTYDELDNPTRIKSSYRPASDQPQAVGAWCYTYDALNRLRTARTGQPDGADLDNCQADADSTKIATGPAYNLTYGYNVDRLSTVNQAGNADTASYSYGTGANPTPHQATSISARGGTGMPRGGTLEYDVNGRISTWEPATTELDGYTYTYDHQGNLSAANPTGGAQPKTTYAYGHNGLRLVRRTEEPGGKLVTVLYRSDGTELTRTQNGGTSTLTAVRQVTTLDGTPVATYRNGGWTWLLADLQGTVRMTVNPSGANRYLTYTPFGEPTGFASGYGPDDSSGNRGYLNKPHDPNGDIRLDHRNYTPNLNILTAPDPLLDPTDPQSLNPYAYARNNPIGLSDASGLRPCVGNGSCPFVEPDGSWSDVGNPTAIHPVVETGETCAAALDCDRAPIGVVDDSGCYGCASRNTPTLQLSDFGDFFVATGRFFVVDERPCVDDLTSAGCGGQLLAAGPWGKFFKTARGVVKGLDDVAEATTRHGDEAAKTVQGPARSTDDLLRSFGSLSAGKQKYVKTVASETELRQTFDAWAVGAERLQARGPKVPDVYQLPDGTVIQWRTASDSGGATIDIFTGTGRPRKVHVE